MDDGSCNHMTCRCGAEFCWLCLKEISDLHYLSPSGCKLLSKLSPKWTVLGQNGQPLCVKLDGRVFNRVWDCILGTFWGKQVWSKKKIIIWVRLEVFFHKMFEIVLRKLFLTRKANWYTCISTTNDCTYGGRRSSCYNCRCPDLCWYHGEIKTKETSTTNDQTKTKLFSCFGIICFVHFITTSGSIDRWALFIHVRGRPNLLNPDWKWVHVFI